jgi:uncharacterized protein (DUF983 family)
MLKKGYKLYSILFGKCPRCHEESMYEEKNLFKLNTTLKLNEKCSHCNLKYHLEPSFFYGSMYVSYPIGIAFAVPAFIISHFIFKAPVLITFFVITGTLIICLPIIARLSRNLWINFFVNYDKDAVKNAKKED